MNSGTPRRRLSLWKLAAIVAVVVVLAGAGLAAVLSATTPETVPASALPRYVPDLDNGETMFAIGGCASCHAVPNADKSKVDRTRLGGGLALKTAFGTFYAPNISPDRNDGIGHWSEANFISAMWKGTDEHGRNLYPVFPYTSYQSMRLDDVRDLFAYLKTLPPVAGRPPRHELAFPFNYRRLIGFWKLLFLHGGQFMPDPTKSTQWNRGAYLVEGPGHCAECHSPRNMLGAIMTSQRFAGGPAADGDGWVPNITPTGLKHWSKENLAWSEKDIASFLDDGMNPAGDYAGGSMAEVIRNTSQLEPADRAAIAAYIASLPAVEGPKPPPEKN
jgi:mono/diheme cytochrome c family protein